VPIIEGTQPTPTHPTGTTTTSATFTPETGALLVALVAANGLSTAASTASLSDSLGGTWTLLKRVNVFSSVNGLGGTTEVWCRDSPGTSMTVTASGWGANAGNLTVRTLIGALPAALQVGATGASTTGAAVPPTAILTPTQSDSWIYGACLDYTTNASMVANAQSSLIDQFQDATNGDTWATFKGAAGTSALSSTTYGFTNANAAYNVAVAEILAAGSAASPVVSRLNWPGRVLSPIVRGRLAAFSQALGGAAVVAGTAEGGVSALGLAATGTAVHVGNLSGTGPLGLASSGTAKKVVAQSGVCCLGAGGTGAEKKVAPAAGSSTVGLAGSSTDKKVAVERGPATLGLAGTGVDKKLAVERGTTAAGLATSGTAAKKTAESGQATVGLAGVHSGTVPRQQSGASYLGLAGAATDRKVARPVGSSPLGLASSATETKRVPGAGRSTLGLTGRHTALPIFTPILVALDNTATGGGALAGAAAASSLDEGSGGQSGTVSGSSTAASLDDGSAVAAGLLG